MSASNIRATPFHARTAAANFRNCWTLRNGFTLAADFGDPQAEALTARTHVVIADISWRWRVWFEGPRTSELLARFATRDLGVLVPGGSLKTLWLNDGGAVRGAGVFARYDSDRYMLASAGTDQAWLSNAASQFDVSAKDVTEREGGLALIGPYAKAVLDDAGLNVDIAPLGFQKLFWRNLDITISRWGEQDGYELWCAADDCLILWDRLMRAGAPFGIRPAGLAACDILDIEAGVPRPERDFMPAGDGFVSSPTPASLGLESLIGEQHVSFNGRAVWLANRASEKFSLVGIEIDSERPAPFAPLLKDGRAVGHMLSSVRSPMLRRAIGLAQVDKGVAAPGTVFSLTLPLSLENAEHRNAVARVASLPFVNPPDSINP